MSQLVGRIERQPDTVQTEHLDWGFRFTPLFGIDYRYIAAAGWQPAESQLLQHNDLYGFHYPELYGMVYVPKVAQGMIVKVGRYISPPDIEAQLSPDNFLYTHSIMFTYDAYTHTGIQNTIKLNDQWMVQAGLHAGTDTRRGLAVPTHLSKLLRAGCPRTITIPYMVARFNQRRFIQVPER